MNKEQLNTILAGLCTGRALATEAVEQAESDDCMHFDDKQWLIEETKGDLNAIQEAINLVEDNMK